VIDHFVEDLRKRLTKEKPLFQEDYNEKFCEPLEEEHKIAFNDLNAFYIQSDRLRYIPAKELSNDRNEIGFRYMVFPKLLPKLLCSPEALVNI
jgi:hypothetical protein